MSWAIITGASSGIGAATAKALAEANYSLYLVARREERLKTLADQLKKINPKQEYKIASIDIAKKSEVDGFFKEESKNLENVDVLVNNAGLAKGNEPVQTANTDDWDTMIDTNIRGLLYFTRGVLPAMVKKDSGHIINVGSVAGRWVYPGGAVYCGTKFAVLAITEGIRMDLIGKNIRVTNIEPGMVNTEFSAVRFNDQDKAKKVYENMTPLKGEDIADCIVWCLKRPRHVNIQELVVFPTDQAAIRQVHRTEHRS
jgi:3-hydroxy acid dehydrogenase / malonic semialdehyde reductase